MDKLHALKLKMIEYERGCPHRVQHFLKVHAFARMIGIGEGLDEGMLYNIPNEDRHGYLPDYVWRRIVNHKEELA